MKKLTAGIFATLLAVVSTGAANARIASQAYVDEKDAERVAIQQETNNGVLTTSATGAVQVSATIPQSSVAGLDTTLAGKVDDADLANYATKTALTDGLATKASQSDVTALTGRVTTAEGEIDALQAPTAQVAEGVTGPVSGGTVYDAIEGVTGNVGSVTGRVDTLEGEMDTAQSDISELQAGKQDKNMGAGAANHIVTTDGSGNITSSATITQGQVAGLNTALDAKADKSALDGKVDANKAISAGTGTKITYDAKGLVTGSASLTASDIPALTTDKITGLDTELDSKASQTDLTALTGRVTTAEGDIDALQAPTAQVAEGVTGPVSGQTVFNAIQGVTGDVTGVTGRVDTLEDEMDTAQSDISGLKTGKQDKLTGPVGSATQPVYVNAEGNVVAGTAYGSLATKNQVANADVADNAAIAQSKIANLVTDLAAKITAPATSETGETGTWVLTYDGTNFQWEDITRAGE